MLYQILLNGLKLRFDSATYMYLIDYAAAHNIEYVLFDEGWSARNDLLSVNPETDVPAVCEYAKNKGAGVCLWAKWINLDNQMRRLSSGCTIGDETYALDGELGKRIVIARKNGDRYYLGGNMVMARIHVQYYDSPCGEIVLGSVGEGLWRRPSEPTHRHHHPMSQSQLILPWQSQKF